MSKNPTLRRKAIDNIRLLLKLFRFNSNTNKPMFSAKFKIEGNEYRVLKFQYELDRDIDQTGRPAGDVRGGTVSLTIESSQETMFWDWMIDAYARKDGEIEFYKRDEPTPAKVVKFTEAYMISYGEKFDVTGGEKDQPMIESFTVSAKELAIGEPLVKEWPS